MNEVLRQLKERHSCRVFRATPVEPDVKRAILDAAIQAPTAGNMALYTILDITDLDIKDALSRSCDNQHFISTAPIVLIFCADYRRWYNAFCQVEPNTRKPGMGDLFLAQADAIIAAQNAAVAAQSLGLGSCYIGDITEHYEFHVELLKLPKYVVPAAMLVMGYPTSQQLARPKPDRFRLEDLVHENGYDIVKSDAIQEMIGTRENKSGAALHEYLRRFCHRKWNSDFSVEMSRSCAAMVEAWLKEDK